MKKILILLLLFLSPCSFGASSKSKKNKKIHPIIEAIRNNKPELILNFLKGGIDPLTPTKQGLPACVAALKIGQKLKILQAFIKNARTEQIRRKFLKAFLQEKERLKRQLLDPQIKDRTRSNIKTKLTKIKDLNVEEELAKIENERKILPVKKPQKRKIDETEDERKERRWKSLKKALELDMSVPEIETSYFYRLMLKYELEFPHNPDSAACIEIKTKIMKELERLKEQKEASCYHAELVKSEIILEHFEEKYPYPNLETHLVKACLKKLLEEDLLEDYDPKDNTP